MTSVVPVTIYALYFTCSEEAGGCPPPLWDLTFKSLQSLRDPQSWARLWDTEASLVYLAWLAYTVVCWKVLPGDWVEGTVMRNGDRKKYKINGAA
jgi:Delta14-sterol reductase